MITDLDLLRAIAAHRSPLNGVRAIAKLIGIEHDDDLARQLSRLVGEEKLSRWPMIGSGFHYSLDVKGRELLKAEGDIPPPLVAPPVSALITTETKGPIRTVHRIATDDDKDDNNTEEETTMAQKLTDRARIVELISGNSGIQPAQIAEKLGIKVSTIYVALNELKKAGRIAKADGGGWMAKAGAGLGSSPINEPSKRKAAAAPKKKAAKRRPRKASLVKVKVRAPYGSRTKTVKVSRAAAKRGNKDEILAAAKNDTVASFTKSGEIVVAGVAGVKRLDVDESREVVELVRAFDNAGLLPKAA